MRKKAPGLSALGFLFLLSSVAVIAAILVPNFVRARSRSGLTACKSNLKNIGTACEMYGTDWKGLYPKEMSLLTPNYLKTIPSCPHAGRDTYSASYEVKYGRVDSIDCGKHRNVDSESCRTRRSDLHQQLATLPSPPKDLLGIDESQRTCPVGDPYSYRPYADYYWVCCQGPNHPGTSVPENYPQYDGIQGLIER
jgi:hypothetical protein